MSTRRGVVIVAAALVFVLMASQALAGAVYFGQRADTAEVTGRAAFAYLGSLRRFAAAVLWNRLDPQAHAFYDDQSLTEQSFMVPTLALVQALDPQFIQSYYLSSYIVGSRMGYDKGVEIARDGVRNNPKSGLMRANLVQLLIFDGIAKNAPEIAEQTAAGMQPDMQWADAEELFEGLVVFRDAYRILGDEATAGQIEAMMDDLRDAGIGLGDHDHDGDGEQDH